MLRHMISHDQAPGIPEPVVAGNTWQTYGLLVGFGLSIPVFFITDYGWVLWIIGPCWCTGCTGCVKANSDTPGSHSPGGHRDGHFRLGGRTMLCRERMAPTTRKPRSALT